MNKKKLLKQRALLVREAEALKGASGEFANDEARGAFDAKMTEVDAIDVKIRALEVPAPPADPDDADDDPAPTDPAAIERARVLGIQQAVRASGLDEAMGADLVTRGVALEAARSTILDKLVEKQQATPTSTHITLGEDARDKRLRGQMYWLLQRSGMLKIVAKHEQLDERTMDPGEFRGMTLIDLAREALVQAGQTVRGLDRMTIAGHAMAYRANYQTQSDFAVLLENTMHKILRAAYATAPDTWRSWCGVATVSDFRTHNWYRTGALSVLEDLNEQGEFKNKAIPDGEKATHSASTKGNIIAITRQVIVNDDLGFVTRLTAALGRSAALTIESAAYALLAQNSGLGPTQSDSEALFHSNRNNVGAGAALSAAALDADAAVMAAQTDPSGNEILNLQPDVLLVPRGLRGQANVINESQFDPDTVSNKAQMKPNVARGFFRTIVGTTRLTGTRRYMFADPAVAPVFVVSFLEGQEAPVLETQDGWRVDGVEMKGRLDVGVNAVDFRGALTDAGQ
jgi:hypothetical protein